jgi:predicted nucleotidyltransferase
MMPPPTVSNDLKDLARLLADWAAPASGVTVYLFGSRVRGDHKADSDVDSAFSGRTASPWATCFGGMETTQKTSWRSSQSFPAR